MTQIITTSSTTAGVNITAEADEFIYVGEGVTRASSGGTALSSSLGGADIQVLGSLVGAGNSGMNLFDAADDTGDFHVTIGTTGTVIGAAFGLFLDDANNTVANQGQITAVTGSAVVSQGANFRIANAGVITSHGQHGIHSEGAGANIVNYGLIQALNSASYVKGVDFFDNDTGVAVTLTNFGIVSAASGHAVAGDSDDVDKIFNFGTFNGDVEQGGGNDIFRNAGEVIGNVDLGTGSDLFKGKDGSVDGVIHGLAGNDTIIGGESDDTLFGDFSDDVLKGGNGDDSLIGGNGHDLMWGGTGSDTFDFNRAVESVAGSDRDHINDFTKGEDVIDLAGIDANAGVGGNQAFTFIGSAAYSGAAGELRAINSGANAIVAFDDNGDGVSDFLVLVVGVHGLTAGDFIL